MISAGVDRNRTESGKLSGFFWRKTKKTGFIIDWKGTNSSGNNKTLNNDENSGEFKGAVGGRPYWPQHVFSKSLYIPVKYAYSSLCAFATKDDGADTLSSTLPPWKISGSAAGITSWWKKFRQYDSEVSQLCCPQICNWIPFYSTKNAQNTYHAEILFPTWSAANVKLPGQELHIKATASNI